MQKFSIAIDVKQIQKSRLRQNSFTKKDGTKVEQTLCDVVGIPLKEKKLIKTGDTWEMYKTGFLVEKGTKEENTNILGDIMEFETKGVEQNQAPEYSNQEISPEDLPF